MNSIEGALLCNVVRALRNPFPRRCALVPALAVFLLSFALPALAQEWPFLAGTIIHDIGETLETQALDSGDIDHDGDEDVVLGGRGVVWLRKDAGGVWSQQSIPGAADCWSIAFADLDRDGDLDIIAGTDTGLVAYENADRIGSTWNTRIIFSHAPGARAWPAIQVADLDRDGDPDLIAADETSGKVVWFENDGTPWDAAWTEHEIAALLVGACDVFIADLDRDGDLDVLAAGADTSGTLLGMACWYENTDGHAGAWTRHTLLDSWSVFQSIAAEDINRDGQIDVVIGAGGEASAHHLIYMKSDGTPADGGWTRLDINTATHVYDLAVRDIDVDGDLDCIAACGSGGMIWWENDGTPDNGGWSRHVFDSGFLGTELLVADLDEDADPDVLGATGDSTDPVWWENRSPHWMAQFPTAPFMNTTFLSARWIRAGDLDRDGDTDLISHNGASAVWWENPGDVSAFWPQHTIGSMSGSLGEINLADMDNDGDLDLVASWYIYNANPDDNIIWFENRLSSSETWLVHAILSGIDGGYRFDLEDVDRDGDLDIGTFRQNTISDAIWCENTNNGAGPWNIHVIENTTAAIDLDFQDIDRDGDLDCFVGLFENDQLAWYQNMDGVGGSWSFRFVATLDSPARIAVGDVDRDGDPDWCSGANSGSPMATFLYRNDDGAGNIWSTHTISPNKIPNYMEFFDIDNDRDLDLLFPNPNAMGYYENASGDGTGWTLHQGATELLNAATEYAADFDRDGDLDISVAAFSDDTPITIWIHEKRHYRFSTTNLAPSTAYESADVVPLRIDVTHLGRASDSDWELAALDFLFEESAGDPLSTSEANALFAAARIYRDDGSGGFEAARDPLIAALDTFSLTNGAQHVVIPDNQAAAAIAPLATASFFLVLQVNDSNVAKPVTQFRVSHCTSTGGVVEHRDFDRVLTPDRVADTASGVVVVEPRPTEMVPPGPRTETVPLVDYNQIRYVDIVEGDNSANGSMSTPWQTIAYALTQVGLPSMTNRWAILVAKGIYDQGITVPSWVDLYGGFDGQTWNRDVIENATTIRGDVDRSCIVTLSSDTGIDGFFITHQGSYYNRAISASVPCTISNNAIFNLSWPNNLGPSGSSAIFVPSGPGTGSALIYGNYIGENSTASTYHNSYGGGIFLFESGTIRHNIILNNINNDASGGAIYIGGGTVSIENNMIVGNRALFGADGIETVGNTNITDNCLFWNKSIIGNSTVGGISGATYVANNTLYYNNDGYSSYPGGISNSTTIVNNIVWNPTSGGQISSCTNVTYNCIYGGYAGTGNISSDPIFRLRIGPHTLSSVTYDSSNGQSLLTFSGLSLESDAWKGYPIIVGSKHGVIRTNSAQSIVVWGDMTAAGTVTFTIVDYRLLETSPCIETGRGVFDIVNDFEGESRPSDPLNVDGDWNPYTGGTPDIGADEYWDYTDPVFAGLQSAELGDGSVILSWNPATDRWPVRYNIYIGLSSGGQDFNASPAFWTTDTTFEVTGIIADRWYYFVVRAEDSFNNEEKNTVELSAKPRSVLFSLALEGTQDSQRLSGFYGGGSDHAHPALADMDGDDDPDLFIGKGDGTLTFWQNTGSRTSGVWSAPEHEYAGIQTGLYAAPALGDLDGDGDMDMVVGDLAGALSFYRNVGNKTAPGWTFVQNDFAGVQVGSNSIPALGDLDDDGDLDLVVGGFNGTLTYVENLGGGAWSAPFAHYANVAVAALASPALVDVDGDGDLDLIVGDVLGRLTYMENTGTPASAAWDADPVEPWLGIAVGQDASPSARPRGDGRMDLFVGYRKGEVTSYVITGGAIEAASKSFSMVDIGDASAAALGDLDGDGDLDALVGGADGRLTLLQNLGGSVAPLWSPATAFYAGIDVGSYSMPALADLDADGRVDLVIGAQDGRLRHYQNQGTVQSAQFVLTDSFLAGIDVGYFSAPLLFDADADGDLDLLVGAYDGTLTFCENLGSAAAPIWGPPQPGFLGLNVGVCAVPAAGDLDGDGITDLLIGREDGQLTALYNEGSNAAPSWTSKREPYSGIEIGRFSTPLLSDIDGDGDMDLLLGEDDGGLNFYRNMKEHLRLSPRTKTLVKEESVEIQVLDAPTTNGFSWLLARNDSGGGFVILDPPTASRILYTAGALGGPNLFDVLVATNNDTGRFARAHINVIRSTDVGSTGKAVICAGRKYETDSVWPATDYLARMAYKVLRAKGFTRDDIYYLSPVIGVDVDEDGDANNDMDALSTTVNLDWALNTWAAGTHDLTLYLVDHGWEEGGVGRFRCNEGEANILRAEDLDAWLDGLQASAPMAQKVIIDCCNSGAFLAALKPPAGRERLVATSCRGNQLTYFVATGLISFSESLWNSVFGGATFGQAFVMASEAMDRYQAAQFDANGDGLYTPGVDSGPGSPAWDKHIGLSWIVGADRPQIGKVVSNQALQVGETQAALWAGEVSGAYAIERVWAIIVPPNFQPDPDVPDPVLTLPEVEFAYDPPSDRWTASYDQFTRAGSYKVIIYARDIWDSVSFPKQVYVHKTEMNEKAILVVGATAYSAGMPLRHTQFLGDLAYKTFRNRGFLPDKLHYLSNETGNADVDAPVTWANLQDAVQTWAGSVAQLTVFIVGKGSPDAIELNATETLTAAQLDGLLDDYQTASGAKLVVILDAIGSGTFLDDLAPTGAQERVTLTSGKPDAASYCMGGGILSFSHFLFSMVFEGSNLKVAFQQAQQATKYWTSRTQDPGLDDDGDGQSSKNDGERARETFLGAAYLTGGDDLPTIGAWMGDRQASIGETIALWAGGVFDSDGIAAVKVTIVPQSPLDPDNTLTLDMVFDPLSGRWSVAHAFAGEGDYAVCFVATDKEGNDSLPATAMVMTGGDAYEIDDTWQQATQFLISDVPEFSTDQLHNFHDPGDEDWVKFHARGGNPGIPYSLHVLNPEANCDAVIELYGPDGTTLLATEDNAAAGEPETLSYDFATSGTYYWRVYNYDANVWGDGTGYTLRLTDDSGANNGLARAIGGNTLRCSWPPGLETGDKGFVLYHAPALTPTQWEAVNTTPLTHDAIDPATGHVTLDDTGLQSEATYLYYVCRRGADDREQYWTSVFLGTTEPATLVEDWMLLE